MERANRPTQVGAGASREGRPGGVGQTFGGQAAGGSGSKSQDDGWAQGLAREYDNKVSEQDMAGYEESQGSGPGQRGSREGTGQDRQAYGPGGSRYGGQGTRGEDPRGGMGQTLGRDGERRPAAGRRPETGNRETPASHGAGDMAGYGGRPGGMAENGGQGQGGVAAGYGGRGRVGASGTGVPGQGGASARYGGQGQNSGASGTGGRFGGTAFKYGSRGQDSKAPEGGSGRPGSGALGQNGKAPGQYGSQDQNMGASEPASQGQNVVLPRYGGQSHSGRPSAPGSGRRGGDLSGSGGGRPGAGSSGFAGQGVGGGAAGSDSQGQGAGLSGSGVPGRGVGASGSGGRGQGVGPSGSGSQGQGAGLSGSGVPGRGVGAVGSGVRGRGVGLSGPGSQSPGVDPSGSGVRGQGVGLSGPGSQGPGVGPSGPRSQSTGVGLSGPGSQSTGVGMPGSGVPGGAGPGLGMSGAGGQVHSGSLPDSAGSGQSGNSSGPGPGGFGGVQPGAGSQSQAKRAAGAGRLAGDKRTAGAGSQKAAKGAKKRGGQKAKSSVSKRPVRQSGGDSRRTKAAKANGRKPPGTGAGRFKGRGGGDRAAQSRDRERAGGAYEARTERAGSNSQNSGAYGRQRSSQAGPPGHASSGRKKPGAGINFLVQGSILAAAGIIVRLIGMVYRIPLAKKIGDVGNGYYNAAYSIYSILLIMSSYSLPTAVSKMVSARLAKGQYRTSTKIFRASMFYATIAGMAGFCALWFGADYFASQVIKMPYSSYALKSLAPTIWVMAYLGVLRGYFQGHSTMIPTAVSQIFEQVVNAVVSIVAASVLFDIGVKSNLVFHDTEYSYAFGAAGGAIGTGAGALTALVLFLLLTMGYVPTMRKQAKRDKGSRVESYGTISRALFVTIVPIIISSAIYNISNVVDNSIFGHVMENLGESGQTASQWGVYMGRYHMLFNIPVAIANSLSSSLIPSLSRAMAGKNRKEVLSKINSAIRFSMIIAIPSAVGLTVLAGPVSNLLFSGMDNEMLIRMMAVGSSAVVFFSLSTVSNAILQGLNRMQVPIINSAVALGVHVAALYGMLRGLRLGIYSVVYANILFAALVCLLNAVSIARYTGYRQEFLKTFFIPCVASAAMGGAAWGIHALCVKAVGNGISTAAAIVVAMAVYFLLLILLKGVNAQELLGMPGGAKVLAVAKKLRLM